MAEQKFKAEFGEPSTVKEIITILKEHAEATTGEEVKPKIVIETDKK